MRNIVLGFIVLLYTGCGSTSEKPTIFNTDNSVSTQQMLDSKNYEGVVSKLEDIASTNDEYLQLATAYMGLSGLTTNDIKLKLYALNSSDDNSFMSLTNSIDKSTKNCQVPLEYLDKSSHYYAKITGDECTQYNEHILTSSEKKICLYRGFSQLVETVTAISYITGDVENLVTNVEDNKLTTASCAMQYAFNGNSDCSFHKKESIKFSNDQSYDRVTIYSNHEEYQYLLTDNALFSGTSNIKNVVMTNGYCTLDDFSTRVTDKNDTKYNPLTYFICPIHLTADDVLIDSLNEGIEAIIVGAENDTKIIESVKKFKEEILNHSYQRDDDIKMNSLLRYFGKYTD
jgi:hypothetical protein